MLLGNETISAAQTGIHPNEFFAETKPERIDMEIEEGEKNPRFLSQKYSEFCGEVRIGKHAQLDFEDSNALYHVIKTPKFTYDEMMKDLISSGGRGK